MKLRGILRKIFEKELKKIKDTREKDKLRTTMSYYITDARKKVLRIGKAVTGIFPEEDIEYDLELFLAKYLDYLFYIGYFVFTSEELETFDYLSKHTTLGIRLKMAVEFVRDTWIVDTIRA